MKPISVESKRASKPSQVGVFPAQSSPMPAAETASNEAQAEPADEIGVNVAKAMPAGSSATRLSRDRTFTLFWAGQTFDAIGDAAASIIIPLLVIKTTGSITQVGLVTAAFGVGTFLSGIISGHIVDSADRRRLLILCDVGRTALYLLILGSWLLSGPNMWLLYIGMLIAGYLTNFFVITYTSVVPSIVDRDQITQANGRLQATIAVTYVAGPMLAGFTCNWLGSDLAIGMVALAYVASAVLMFFVRLRKSPNAEAPPPPDTGLGEMLAGIRFLVRHPVLRSVTLLVTIFTFVSQATVNLSIFRLKDSLNQNDDAVGVLFGIASLGAVIAAAFAAKLHRKLGFGLCFLGGLILQSITMALLGLAPSVTTIAILAVALSFAFTIRGVSVISLRQQVTPDYLLGRVSSALWTLVAAAGPIGGALATLLAQHTGVVFVLVLMGVVGFFIAITGFLTAAYTRLPDQAALPNTV